MKKVLFLLAVAFFFFQAPVISQNSRVGVTAGITSSNMYGTVDSVDAKGGSKTGITFGLFIDAPIGKSHFSFQPGVHYMQKGKVISETNKVKSWYALRYIDAQMNFVYNSNTKTNFFVGLGPVVSFELPSKLITRTNNATAAEPNPDPQYSTSEKSLRFGKETLDDFRGLDYGADIMAGFRMKCGFLLSVNYTFGIRNIATETSNDEVRNGVAAVRIGWLFNNK